MLHLCYTLGRGQCFSGSLITDSKAPRNYSPLQNGVLQYIQSTVVFKRHRSTAFFITSKVAGGILCPTEVGCVVTVFVEEDEVEEDSLLFPKKGATFLRALKWLDLVWQQM